MSDIDLLKRLNADMNGDVFISHTEFIGEINELSSDAQSIVMTLIREGRSLLGLMHKIVDAHPDQAAMDAHATSYTQTKTSFEAALADGTRVLTAFQATPPEAAFTETTALYDEYTGHFEAFLSEFQTMVDGLDDALTVEADGTLTLTEVGMLQSRVHSLAESEALTETGTTLTAVTPRLEASIEKDRQLIDAVVDLAS